LESIKARLSLIDKNIGTSAGFTHRPITLRNHIPKNMYFPYSPLRHFYGYATVDRD